MVQTPGGIKALDILTTSVIQVTAALTGVGSLVALAISLRQQLIDAGATTEEAQAALAALDAAIDREWMKNEAWLPTHPRIPTGTPAPGPTEPTPDGPPPGSSTTIGE